jgi:serine/threonine protein kinase
MPLTRGIGLGPYEIVAPVGAGGLGEVYRARDTRLDRTVAIKVVHASFAGDAERLRRFDQEARAGHRTKVRELLPAYRAGVVQIEQVTLSDGGKSYAYSCNQFVSHLAVFEGVK